MKNWFKTFWKDLGNLPKGLFFHKYILPTLAIFFSWGLVGHILLVSLDKNSLVSNKGNVTSIEVRFEQGTRATYKYYPLKIGLTNYSEEYRLPDTYKTFFPYLQQEIIVGDSITLYTRNRWQTILGWGRQNDIYQIDKSGQTLFDISEVINEKKNQLTLLLVFSLILWIWYVIYRRIK